LVEVIRTIRSEDFLEGYARAIVSTRNALDQRDTKAFANARGQLVLGSERASRLLGGRGVFEWKPPGQPLTVSIPRELIPAYLAELGDDPFDPWTRRLEGMLLDQIAVTGNGLTEHRRKRLLLTLFPPYWLFGIAGLLVELLAYMLEASRLLPRSAIRSTPVRVVGGVLQWTVTGLELYGFYKLFAAGMLFA